MRDRSSRIATPGVLTKPVASFVGGHIALDFCNTAGEHLAEQPDEMLLDWESFIRWAVQTGLIRAEAYSPLLRHAAPINEIVDLREAIYKTGLAVARGERPSATDLLAMRTQANASKPPVANGRGHLCWQPEPAQASEQLRAILAHEALSLFCSPRSLRIGICEGGKCGWLFLDESRGKRRRWCDMKDCGNKAKARRYYEQQHKNK